MLFSLKKDLALDSLAETFDKFVTEAHRLKQLYSDRITLLVGLETEYITDEDLQGLESLLKKYENKIQYIVGSLHHVNTIPIDFDEATFRRAVQSCGSEDGDSDETEKFLHEYFDAQFTLMRRFCPEIIGHFDLCRLYTPTLDLTTFPRVWEKIERNIDFAIAYNALFELNAAAFRKGWDNAYPGSDVVQVSEICLCSLDEMWSMGCSYFQLIKQKGGRFTLSDDSHGVHAVGLNYNRLGDYLKRAGVDQLWYLDSPGESAMGRTLVPVLCEDIALPQ